MIYLDEADGHRYVELVMRVPPLSTAAIEASAYAFLYDVAPEHLRFARPLNILHLIDYALPQLKAINFGPVEDAQLPDAYAKAIHGGAPGQPIDVLMRKSEWDALERGGPSSHHPRASVAHEIGHCVLHVPEIRRRRAQGLGLPRQLRSTDLETFENPEWQAWCFAGFLLAPRSMIMQIPTSLRSPGLLAEVFGCSPKLMAAHLRRVAKGGHR